jgi:NAD(P) transhydrogenase subunit alpha
MTVAVLKETAEDEMRVALAPAHVPELTKAGLEVVVEEGAGRPAGIDDQEYRDKGAEIASRADAAAAADILLSVRAAAALPEDADDPAELLKEGAAVIGFADPYQPHKRFRKMKEKGLSLFAMELMPRITRAQSMDVLSSMANLGGYKGVILAADYLPRMFPMMMTAAGTILPAEVFVLGVGVAGLQAIATAKRLGAVVSAYDIRPEVKEQVKSLGAKFLEVELEADETEAEGGYAKEMDEEFYRKQREMMAATVADSDVVITTAAVPGKKAPVLVTEEMVKGMQPGSVIVDLASERGGNCELTEHGEVKTVHGVTVIGPRNIPSTLAYNASRLYSKNVTSFLLAMVEDGELNADQADEIVSATQVLRAGEVPNDEIRTRLEL